MVTITLYAKQKKRHRCTEQRQSFEGERKSRFILCRAKREYSKLVPQEVFSPLQGETNQDMEIFSAPQNILQCSLLVSTILPTLELTHLHHHRLFLSVLELLL